jgi:hypothetical protein
VSADVGVDINFYVFAAAGLVGAVLISLVPRRRTGETAVPSVEPVSVIAEAALGR